VDVGEAIDAQQVAGQPDGRQRTVVGEAEAAEGDVQEVGGTEKAIDQHTPRDAEDGRQEAGYGVEYEARGVAEVDGVVPGAPVDDQRGAGALHGNRVGLGPGVDLEPLDAAVVHRLVGAQHGILAHGQGVPDDGAVDGQIV